MGGLYDILQSYRQQNDPRFVYDGLYQDRDRFLDYDNSRNDFTNQADYPFTGNIPTNRLARYDARAYNRNEPLPNDPYGVESDYFDNFDLRVGTPEQSIYYNEPEPADPTSDFYQPLPGFINAPQDGYASLYSNQPDFISVPPKLDTSKFQGVSDMSKIDETTNDEQDQDYIEQVEKSRNSLSGIMDLLRNIPTPFNLARRGLESLRGVNQRLRNTDFGRSKTLMDYLDARKYGGIDARDRAAQQNMREARGIQTQVDRRGDSTSRVADRNRSSVTRSSAARSRGVGGGGYTKSDSNRESYRG